MDLPQLKRPSAVTGTWWCLVGVESRFDLFLDLIGQGKHRREGFVEGLLKPCIVRIFYVLVHLHIDVVAQTLVNHLVASAMLNNHRNF